MVGAANDLNINTTGFQTFNQTNGVFNGRTLTAGSGITISNGDGQAGNPVIASTGSLTDLHAARYIVSAGGSSDGANYTTIASAYAAAVGTGTPQTVFIQPGIYTENITLSANVNLAAFVCDATTPNVTILGKLSATFTGRCSISGINLQTNGDVALAITGSNATIIFLDGCAITMIANTGMSMTSSNSASEILANNCFTTDNGTNALFVMTGAGPLKFYNSILGFSGTSTVTGSVVSLDFTECVGSISTSSTGGLSLSNSFLAGAYTFNGSGTSQIFNSEILNSGATPVTIGASGVVTTTDVSLFTNAGNAIAGSGTLKTTPISFTGASSTIQNTLTITQLPFLPALNVSNGGTGNTTFTAYSVIAAGTAATGPFQNVSGVGTSGQVLTSNGAAALPTWQTASGGVTGPGSSTDRAIATWNGTGGTALFNNSTAKIDSNGIMTNSAQPCFFALLTSSASNVTGDTTVYQVAFDTVAFDNGSNFTTGGSAHFTAPVTGRYHFEANLNASFAVASVSYLIGVSTAYPSIYFSFGNQTTGQGQINGSVTIPMTAGDTFALTLQGAASTKTTTVQGSSNPLTWLCGYLVC